MDYPQPAQPSAQKSKTVLILWVILIVLLLLDGVVAFGIFQHNQNTNTPASGDVASADDPYFGSTNAQIVIVEFSDFQCPYCLQAFPIVHEIMQTYGDKIKFIYRDFPDSVRHPDAENAAEAGECAHAQGKFWEYHDKLFINHQDLSVAALKQYAIEIGLDTAAFNKCLDNHTYAKEVQQDLVDGYNAGVRGTPTFFINGSMFEGVIPLDSFKDTIDRLLAYYQ